MTVLGISTGVPLRHPRFLHGRRQPRPTEEPQVVHPFPAGYQPPRQVHRSTRELATQWFPSWSNSGRVRRRAWPCRMRTPRRIRPSPWSRRPNADRLWPTRRVPRDRDLRRYASAEGEHADVEGALLGDWVAHGVWVGVALPSAELQHHPGRNERPRSPNTLAPRSPPKTSMMPEY